MAGDSVDRGKVRLYNEISTSTSPTPLELEVQKHLLASTIAGLQDHYKQQAMHEWCINALTDTTANMKAHLAQPEYVFSVAPSQ